LRSPAVPAHDYVMQAELDRAPMRVAISPLPTIFALARDTLQHGRLGMPAHWRRAVLSHFRARDVAALAPLVDRRTTGWPSLLDGVVAPRETSDEALQRLAATTGHVLIQALEAGRDVTPGTAWDRVRQQPDRWIRAYVDAMHRAWGALAPLWRRSIALLDREAETLEAAIERGVSNAQIAHERMHRSAMVDDALLIVPTDEPRRLGIGARGVTITPMLAGPRAGTLSSPGEFLLRFAYPLRDGWRAFDDKVPPLDPLEALLGTPRARFLDLYDDT
jgi:hypothetical protein